MIGIVDYGMGNVRSVSNMLRRIGCESFISSDPEVLDRAKKLILPGVGAYDAGMQSLAKLGLVEPLGEWALAQRRPVLGLCLGMQLFTRSSEEGQHPGLAWVDAVAKRFQLDRFNLPVPHMGWRSIRVERSTPLFAGLESGARFYFVHSYHCEMRDDADVLATAAYGYRFCSALQCGNLWGTQFHPEKSHRYGMRLLSNFVGAR